MAPDVEHERRSTAKKASAPPMSVCHSAQCKRSYRAKDHFVVGHLVAATVAVVAAVVPPLGTASHCLFHL